MKEMSHLPKDKECDKVLLEWVKCSLVEQSSILAVLQIAVEVEDVRCQVIR